MHLWVNVKAFKGAAKATEVRASVLEGTLYARANLIKFCVIVGIAAEVAKVAPDVRLAVIFLMKAPNLLILTPVVEQYELALGHSGKKRLDAFGCPGGLVEIKHPCHLQPCGLRINISEGAIDALSHGSQIGRILGGQFHLIEGVNTIDMISAELLDDLLDIPVLNLCEEAVLRVEEIAACLVAESSPILQFANFGVGENSAQCSRHMS